MGCNESKQDVATGNTITRRKSDVSSMKSIENINETAEKEVNPSLLAQQEESQDVSKDSGGDNAVAASADAKYITNGNKESKANGEEKETEEEKGVVGKEEPGRLISKGSPSRFFSSRKEEDTEAVSEKSEYFSPDIEHEQTEVVQVNDTVEKTRVEETEQGTENGTGAGESATEKEEDQQQKPGEDKLAVSSTNGLNAP